LLGRIGEELHKRGHGVQFVVTLSPEEWTRRSSLFKRHAVNLGPLRLDELPAAYAAADAVVFPSLLEAYSAAPLEGMVSGRLVFASDRAFVRTTCGSGVVYIDPRDPMAWADRLEEWLLRTNEVEARYLPYAAKTVGRLPGPRDRAAAYVNLIDVELERAS
jgi:glycosyltransferase involved in cell wall biosynthesis